MESAIVCGSVTYFMAVLHLLLLFGVPLGEYVMGGNDKVIPLNKRWCNVLFAILFIYIGSLYFQKAGIITSFTARNAVKIIMLVYTVFLGYAAFIGNVFFTKSKKEKILMIPLSMVCFVSSLKTILQI